MCGMISPAWGKKREGCQRESSKTDAGMNKIIYTNTERKLKSAFRTKAHVRSPRGGEIPASVEQHCFRELLETHKGAEGRGAAVPEVSMCCCRPVGLCWQQPSSKRRACCWAGSPSPLGILPAGSGSRKIPTANHCNNTIMIYKIILFNTSERYWKPCPWERGDAKEGEKQKWSGRETRAGQSSTSGITETAVMSAPHDLYVTGEWVHVEPQYCQHIKIHCQTLLLPFIYARCETSLGPFMEAALSKPNLRQNDSSQTKPQARDCYKLAE